MIITRKGANKDDLKINTLFKTTQIAVAEAVKAENSTGNPIRLIMLGGKIFTVCFIRAGKGVEEGCGGVGDVGDTS